VHSPTPSRAAAIDLGTARVGLAVADELGLMAHPRPYLSAKKGGVLLAELRRIADAEGIDHFLVGLPRNMDGSEGPGARRAREFAKLLGERTGRSVELVDERLSTVEAQARLHQQGLDIRRSRERIDSASAAILLQSWLDGRRRSE
jgi:putative Holliday junction resolvase